MFWSQIGDVMPNTASTQPLSALPATFTYAQARCAGVSKHTLYRLREGGRVAAISRGLYRQAGAEPADIDLITIVVKAPGATLCFGNRAGPRILFRPEAPAHPNLTRVGGLVVPGCGSDCTFKVLGIVTDSGTSKTNQPEWVVPGS